MKKGEEGFRMVQPLFPTVKRGLRLVLGTFITSAFSILYISVLVPTKRIIPVVRKLLKWSVHSEVLSKIKVVSGGDGRCRCELKVTPLMLNATGSLHGGVTAGLVDAVSTYALMTTGSGMAGKSIDLNVSYLKPAFADDDLIIEAKTLSCGKTLAVASVDIVSKMTGKLVAQGRHSKFMAQKRDSSS